MSTNTARNEKRGKSVMLTAGTVRTPLPSLKQLREGFKAPESPVDSLCLRTAKVLSCCQ